MKHIIQSCLEKFGYRLISLKDDHQRRKACVNEIDGFYRRFVFKDFPGFDLKRNDLVARLKGTGIGEAMHLCAYLNRTRNIEGDVCEFGVAQGRTSALLAHEIRLTSKQLFLFDSFKGLPKPSVHDQLKDDIFNLGSMGRYAGKMASTVNLVKAELDRVEFPVERVKIVPGFIEETIKFQGLPAKVSFAYVDFDFYEPIKIALEYLHNVLPVGAVVVVDDYDFFSTGAKKAVDEFVAAHKTDYAFKLPECSADKFAVLEKT